MLKAPPSEMQEIISISAQRTKRELANALGIQEVIGPGDFVLPVVDQAVGRSAGGNGRLLNQREFHTDCACSIQATKSDAVAPAAK
jgi:Zn-dependent alcohol dehydrogenase